MVFSLLKTLAQTLFPSFCVHCGKETAGERWLCGPCQGLLTAFPHTVCPSCKARTLEGRLEDSCAEKTGLTRFFCCYPLQQKPLQALMYSYKYRRNITLHGQLSTLLLQWLADTHAQEMLRETRNFIFVPIPLHKEKLRERGFNQAEYLARDLADAFNAPLSFSVLVRVKETPSQLIAHSQEAREKNMEHAFAVKDAASIAGKRVILVDDVYTTGATMKHAALALRRAGAKEVWGMAVARG